MDNSTMCAFPTGVSGDPGLTKHEYFVWLAMQGMCGPVWPNDVDAREIARRSVLMADALLAELENPNG